MAEAAKIARRSAKGKFTRKRNDFLNSVRDRNSIATIEKAYDQLEDGMKDLEGKHEQFTSFLNDEEFDAAENWMSELQTLYRDATNLKNEYMDNIQFDESNARATREREELENQQREQNEKLKENILIKRSGARTLFDAIFSNATHILETENAATSLMKKVLAQLEEAFIECKLRNEQYLELIGKEMMEQELLWISNVQVLYSQIFEIFETRISEKEESKLSETTLCNSNSPGTANNVHLEKIKRPHFEGDIREYPQFKRDFQTQVMPGLTKLTAPYTLRTCLDKEALAQVKSVDDDIEEMWARLDEKFGDPGKVTDVIINDIKRFKVIREGESKKFVEFVDMIEDSYRDLKRLGIEKEITTTSSVSTIESKLPPDHRKEWARLVSSRKSTVDKTDKFPSLLDFLLDQKRAIEYDASDLRSAGTPQVRGATHLSDGRPSPAAKYCLVHGNAKHSTYECRNYLAKPVQQRKDVVKDKLACFSCLKPGHRWVQCKRKKECGIDNCKVFHHRTLHENKRNTPTGEDDQEEEVSGTTNTCSRISSKTTCLLQIQRIKTHANWLNVMWDNASSLSFITNKTAKAQKLHGTTVQLSLVKVGAEKKDITTKKYTLPLIDLQGHQTLIEVYGIDQITSNIRKIKIDGILHIFDVPKKDIERPTGTIDVLIGYDYAGLHPEMQNRSGHLLLLKNRFGFCIGGTHPAIEENAECFKYNVAHVNHVRGIELSDFYKIENLGVECTPRCGGCKCGKCPPGSKNYTLKEEKELNLIENNLEYNSQENLWITTYPWIKDPHNLPDNKRAAYGRLMSTESKNNIADWITRGRKPAEIGLNSIWQTGPEFLRFPEHEWPICKPNYQKELPEQIKTVMLAEAKSEDSLEARIDINRYSNYTKLIRVTARVLSLYKRKPRPSLKNVTSTLTPEDIDRAERFWILRCQKLLTADMEKGIFKRLCPRMREDGIIVVGGRVEKWLEISYNKNDLILLPYEHRFARLYAEYIHQRGHHGVSSTVSKIRARFWITNIQRMVRSIKYNCVICKKIDKQLCQQKMGKLPEERLKPSPPWHYTGIDLFGPFKIRDEVKRRTYGKCYGVIFNCMCTRAVHLDLAPDYSTETFLLVLRRFVSLRGYPAKLYSDNGPQLVAADKELKDITKNWNWDELLEFGVTEGLQWEFSPADAPWYNGTSEALIRSVKRGLNIAIGDNIMTFSELQTACFEVGNLINERPIGKHPTDTDDGVYLSPNDLLLGRSTSRVPSGPFRETTNPRHRFEFVQNIVKSFWRKWTRDYFPSLLIESKWHTAHRDVKVGDVVLIQDSNLVRGNWKLGKVITAKPSKDGRVRRVEIVYKNTKPGEHVKTYRGGGYVTVERPVQRIIVIVPVDENEMKD